MSAPTYLLLLPTSTCGERVEAFISKLGRGGGGGRRNIREEERKGRAGLPTTPAASGAGRGDVTMKQRN